MREYPSCFLWLFSSCRCPTSFGWGAIANFRNRFIYFLSSISVVVDVPCRCAGVIGGCLCKRQEVVEIIVFCQTESYGSKVSDQENKISCAAVCTFDVHGTHVLPPVKRAGAAVPAARGCRGGRGVHVELHPVTLSQAMRGKGVRTREVG